MATWLPLRQVGVPYHRPERMSGKTTNSLMRNIGWARKAIFSFSYIPLEMITVVGVHHHRRIHCHRRSRLWCASSTQPRLRRASTTVIVLILFVGGIQLLCLSVIGSYLAHIYEEVKRRPPYIVADIRNRPSPDRSAWDEPEQSKPALRRLGDEAIRCL